MIQELYNHYLQHSTICIDTRKVTKGCLFFALKGPNFDANTFAKEALEKGAAMCVVDNEKVAEDNRFFLVQDVLKTLQDLARYHRDQLTIPVIGLTGSNGKTTSKELLAAVLSAKYNVYATKGNLNNHIGVPLSILGITSEHEIAVIEMGANHVGEIALLSSISKPSHGYITNIGKAHLEGFGGIEGVIRGKSELYHHLIENDGVVWINSDNEILSNMAKRFKNPLFYPNEGDYYYCEYLDANPEVRLKAENGTVVQTQLIGSYNFENIATALCIGKYFEVPADLANEAAAAYQPNNNRSQVLKKGSNKIILDAYNANPTSMTKALENLSAMSATKKVVVLGDMNELGDDSIKEHEELGKQIQSLNPHSAYLCGRQILPAQKYYPNSLHFENTDTLIDHIVKNPIEGATILVKASRSIGLEKIVDVI